jgi:hypothetical protein
MFVIYTAAPVALSRSDTHAKGRGTKASPSDQERSRLQLAVLRGLGVGPSSGEAAKEDRARLSRDDPQDKPKTNAALHDGGRAA